MPRSPTSSEDEMAQSFSDYSVGSESDSSKEETIYDTIRATAEKPDAPRTEETQGNTLVIRILIQDLQQTVGPVCSCLVNATCGLSRWTGPPQSAVFAASPHAGGSPALKATGTSLAEEMHTVDVLAGGASRPRGGAASSSAALWSVVHEPWCPVLLLSSRAVRALCSLPHPALPMPIPRSPPGLGPAPVPGLALVVGSGPG